MEEDVHRYHGTDIEVSYDSNRCIHVRVCVEGLPGVFDPDERPWIDADGADADEIAAVVEACPTGALQYERPDGAAGETAPDRNTVVATADGPLYVRGDVELVTPDGGTVLEDTRIGLCRCGHSENKPLCDNSHSRVFEAEGADRNDADRNTLPEGTGEATGDGEDGEGPSGPLTVTLQRDGPFTLEGSYDLQAGGETTTEEGGALCRCGGSGNKPFCDGTHAEIGFETDEGE
jgi:CDGSH-type Zn-finger protein/uncharacterized Fe-S cluster protein YjdI